MKRRSLKERKKNEKLLLIIVVIIFIVLLIYQIFRGVASGYDYYPGGWFYERG